MSLFARSRFLQGPKTDRAVVVAMRDAINSGSEFRGMVTNYSRTGTLLYNNLVMTPVKNRDGTVTHYTGIQVGAKPIVTHLKLRELVSI